MDCKLEKNKSQCNCTYEPCPRKGACCECLTYHRNNDELPACYFSAKDEKKYDRSIEFFVKSKGKR